MKELAFTGACKSPSPCHALSEGPGGRILSPCSDIRHFSSLGGPPQQSPAQPLSCQEKRGGLSRVAIRSPPGNAAWKNRLRRHFGGTCGKLRGRAPPQQRWKENQDRNATWLCVRPP